MSKIGTKHKIGDIWPVRAGWCAMLSDGDISGPWRTKEAAELAANARFTDAHETDAKALGQS